MNLRDIIAVAERHRIDVVEGLLPHGRRPDLARWRQVPDEIMHQVEISRHWLAEHRPSSITMASPEAEDVVARIEYLYQTRIQIGCATVAALLEGFTANRVAFSCRIGVGRRRPTRASLRDWIRRTAYITPDAVGRLLATMRGDPDLPEFPTGMDLERWVRERDPGAAHAARSAWRRYRSYRGRLPE